LICLRAPGLHVWRRWNDKESSSVDGPVFGQRFTTNQHQATIIRWGAEWPYPDNWLPELFGSGAGNNHVAYSNAKFDELIKKARAEVDDKKRLAVYSEAQKLIIDEAVVVPLYNPKMYVLVKPNVRGLVITALDGHIKGDYNLHKAYIAAANN